MNKIKSIAAIIAISLAMAGCGNTQVESDNSGSAGQDVSSSSESLTDYDVDAAKNWLTGIWNNCVDIEAYVSRGTDCTGKEIDIEFYIDGAKRDYDRKDGYDKVIHSLDDSIPDQEMLIKAWDKCIEQTDMLLDKAFNETPKPNDKSYDFNIDLLKQYKDQFGDSYRTVKFGDPNVVGTDDGEPKFVFK